MLECDCGSTPQRGYRSPSRNSYHSPARHAFLRDALRRLRESQVGSSNPCTEGCRPVRNRRSRLWDQAPREGEAPAEPLPKARATDSSFRRQSSPTLAAGVTSRQQHGYRLSVILPRPSRSGSTSRGESASQALGPVAGSGPCSAFHAPSATLRSLTAGSGRAVQDGFPRYLSCWGVGPGSRSSRSVVEHPPSHGGLQVSAWADRGLGLREAGAWLSRSLVTCGEEGRSLRDPSTPVAFVATFPWPTGD